MAKKRANGEGNIRKRKDGRWEGRYTAGYDPKTGKRLIKNVLGKTQAEVKEKLKRALEETNGLDVSRAADEYTVASWLRTWYELYAKPNVRTATANRYELIIEQYTVPRIGNIKLKKLTTQHLQKLYKELLESGRIHVGKGQDNGLSTTTVHSVHLMLHCALERAVKERLISRNPCEDCIVPKPRKLDMKILTPEHMKAYLEAADRRGLLPMFYLELVSGLRKGELVALRWDDVYVRQPTISVSKQYVRNPDGSLELTRPKTENSVRLVCIPQTAVDLLIQEQEGKLLKEIIAEVGNEGFLKIENQVNRDVKATRSVISPGGSVVYCEEAMEHFKEIGTVVYLKASFGNIRRRIRSLKKRGVVLKDGQTFRNLYEERTALFEKYADIIVDEDGFRMEETVENVFRALDDYRKREIEGEK